MDEKQQAYQQMDLGPLEPLLTDPAITGIVVNSTNAIYVEEGDGFRMIDDNFDSEEAIVDVIRAILEPLGIKLEERAPLVDVRLPDNSRMNAVLRPVAIHGPLLTLRKFSQMNLKWNDLLRYGSANEAMVAFLKASILARRNMVVSGGTSSGKTSIINALSRFIPDSERIVTVESPAQLMLQHPHVVSLETCPPDRNGHGEVTMSDLVRHAEQMAPHRIITSDVVGSEAWDMLHVMTQGFDGSMFTIHATSAHDVLERLEMMATLGTNLPLLTIRARIAQGVDLITQSMRIADGTRKIVTISEVVGLKNNVIDIQDIFRWEQTGEADGRLQGEYRLTGYKPGFADQLDLPTDFFEA